LSILITGVAGFVGSNLARSMIASSQTIFGIDNLCRGSLKNLSEIENHTKFSFRQIEMTDLASLREAMTSFHAREPITEVWHMAANSDIPAGVTDANVDLRDTFMTTFNTLQVMKELDIGVLAFASSSAIYGDLGNRPLTEDIGPLLPISNYGAMKLASEAAISAAAESYLKSAYIFRFPNVIGVPATHGVMLDFINKLKGNPQQLEVLGNGTQQKGYLHAEDLIDAMLFIRERAKEKVAVFNIGADDDGVTVRFIAEETVTVAAPGATIRYGEGNKGWVGDVPRFTYSTEKLQRLGWSPKLNSEQAVRKAIRQIASQEMSSI
jgi:UDP-glucose 4-epimerase